MNFDLLLLLAGLYEGAHLVFFQMAPGPHCVCLCILLLGRCGRHNSPPVSSVMDFVFCCSDISHVSVDTFHQSPLRSSFFSSRWHHLQESFFRRIVGHVSSRVQTTSILLSYTSMLYALPSVSPRCYNFSHGFLVCGRMPIYTVIFISVTSVFFTWVLVIGTVSIPYSTLYS